MPEESMASTSLDKLSVVRGRSEADILAVDFQLSMLIAAQSSYRHDTVLKPFPSPFAHDGVESKRDHAQLGECLQNMEALSEIDDTWSDPVKVDLLHWLVAEAGPFALTTKPVSHFSHIKSLTRMCVDVPDPNYIFEVVYNEVAESKFQDRRGSRNVHYAFHGSRVENFHSILHYGLHSHMNKNALFGEGTYLSSELSVSMPYAPSGRTWKKSGLGEYLSCIALCEIVDDVSVKCQIQDSQARDGAAGTEATTLRSRARASGSLGGDVPEKYYVVQNNEVLRVKYVVVYADKVHQNRLAHSRFTWLYKHKFELMIALYVVMLLLLGMYNSKAVQSYLKKYSKR